LSAIGTHITAQKVLRGLFDEAVERFGDTREFVAADLNELSRIVFTEERGDREC